MLMRTAPQPAQLQREPGNVLHAPEPRAALGEEQNTQLEVPKAPGTEITPSVYSPPTPTAPLLPLPPACVCYSVLTW